jgi:hypothetical protein
MENKFESDQVLLKNLLAQENTVEMHEMFQSLLTEDLDALQNFPSHPHRSVHLLLAIAYLILDSSEERIEPSFHRLTWPFLRDSLLGNSVTLLHKLHTCLRHLKSSKRSISPNIIHICLIYLQEPVFRIAALRRISSIAVALACWIYLCFATTLPPQQVLPCSRSTSLKPLRRSTIAPFRRSFRHTMRKQGVLYMISIGCSNEEVSVELCNSTCTIRLRTVMPSSDRRFAILFESADRWPPGALFSWLGHIIWYYQWPYESQAPQNKSSYDMKPDHIHKIILRCPFVVISSSGITRLGLIVVDPMSTFATVRKVLTVILDCDFAVSIRGTRMGRHAERHVPIMKLLPVAFLIQQSLPFSMIQTYMRLSERIGPHLTKVLKTLSPLVS